MASAPQAPGPPRKIANSRGPVRRHWNDITNHQPLVRPDGFRNGSISSFRPWASHIRSSPAGSTGRRNTGVKSLCWGFKLQGLTRSFVELTSHFIQMGLLMHRQVGALRKSLSKQAIGILVRAALPRTLRIAKIDVDFGRQRKATMIRKFLAPVPGQGFI